MSSSSESSSSFLKRGYGGYNTSYLCLCRSVSDIDNPAKGTAIGVKHRGWFLPSYRPQTSKPLVEHGGLMRGPGGGAIYASNAAGLFSPTNGVVSLRLELPFAINNGVYSPLVNQETMVYPDFILWGVHLGYGFITPPGIYAALTPDGIEFTIWTASSCNTLINTNISIAAGEDLWLDFGWAANPNTISTGTMFISQDGVVKSQKEAVFDTRSHNNFTNIPFWLLDTPFSTSGLVCTLKRVEIYHAPHPSLQLDLPSSSSSSSGSISESSSSREAHGIAEGELEATFVISDGPAVEIQKIEFLPVLRAPLPNASNQAFKEVRHG